MDYIEYTISDYFLTSLVYGDCSALGDAESRQFEEWQKQATGDAESEGFTVHHWDTLESTGDDWGRCEITGLYSSTVTARLMVSRKERGM